MVWNQSIPVEMNHLNQRVNQWESYRDIQKMTADYSCAKVLCFSNCGTRDIHGQMRQESEMRYSRHHRYPTIDTDPFRLLSTARRIPGCSILLRMLLSLQARPVWIQSGLPCQQWLFSYSAIPLHGDSTTQLNSNPAVYHGGRPYGYSASAVGCQGNNPIACLFPLGSPFPAGAESRDLSFPSIHPTHPYYSHAIALCRGQAPFRNLLGIRLSWHGGAMGLSLSRARQAAMRPCDIAAPAIAFIPVTVLPGKRMAPGRLVT